jgi:type IV secretory pathway TrbD component
MAQRDSKTIGFRADEDLQERIETYGSEQGYDKQSEAVEDLVKTGLREKRQPLLYRAKGSASSIALGLTIAAVVAVVLGFVTTLWTIGQGVVIALVLIASASATLMLVELPRMVSGQNHLGARLLGGEKL